MLTDFQNFKIFDFQNISAKFTALETINVWCRSHWK